jgi:hypothetical protein
MQASPYLPPTPAPAQSPGPGVAQDVSVIRAVKAVFEDPNWKNNVLIGIVFMIIPIVGPIALSGWMCEVQQRLIRRHPNPVPKIDFGDFGDYIRRGLAVFLTNLIVGVPIMLVIYFFAAALGFGAFAAGAAANEPLIAVAVGVVGGLFFIIFAMAISVVVNAAQTRAELTEELGQALAFGQIMAYTKATFGVVLKKNIIFMFVGFGIVLLGMLACYFGLYPAMVVLQISAMHLRNQVYVDYLGKGGEPIPLKPPQALQSEARMPPQPQY